MLEANCQALILEAKLGLQLIMDQEFQIQEEKYQKKNICLVSFYSGQAGNLALDEDANMMKGVVGERLARQRQEAAKRRAKKAQKRALLTSLISTVAMAGIAHGINSMGNSTPVGAGTVLSPTADGGYSGVAGHGTVLSAPSGGFQYDFF